MDPVCIWEPEKCLEVDHLDKINFQDIQAEHINRYQLVPVPGTTDQFDIIPVRGTVTVEGTPVRALELNQLQENIEEGCLSVSGGTLTGQLTTQDIVPDGSGLRNLGTSSNRFSTVYAGNGNFSMGATVNGNEVWHTGTLPKPTEIDLNMSVSVGENYSRFWKNGLGEVHVIINISGGGFSSETRIGSLPTGYYPRKKIYDGVIGANISYAYIDTNGNIYAKNDRLSTDANTWSWFQFSYIAK